MILILDFLMFSHSSSKGLFHTPASLVPVVDLQTTCFWAWSLSIHCTVWTLSYLLSALFHRYDLVVYVRCSGTAWGSAIFLICSLQSFIIFGKFSTIFSSNIVFALFFFFYPSRIAILYIYIMLRDKLPQFFNALLLLFS